MAETLKLGQLVTRLILEKSLDEGHKYTDAEIAQLSGISPSVLSRILKDDPTYYPQAKTIAGLVNGLGPKYGPEVLALLYKMNKDLVDLWKVQDTPAGKAALKQAKAHYERETGDNGQNTFIPVRS